MNNVFKRIEFWIFVLFLVRLIGITNPPLDIGQNWRQITGLMVSRNFVEVDDNILYPRIDDNQGKTGIIGMEFPSMNYLYFGIAKLFGYTHWYGRLINLVVSSLGLLFFYKLILLAGFKDKVAFASTLFLGASIWFMYSRKMMPDTYCISIMFIGLFYGLKYMTINRFYQLLLFAVLCALAVLSKIPAGIYFILLIPYMLNKRIASKQRIMLTLATIPTLVLTYLWYFKWNYMLSSKYGNWYNSGKSIHAGFLEIAGHLDKVFENFFINSFLSYTTLAVFAAGFVMMFVKQEKKLIVIFTLMLFIFLLYIFKSGFFFYHHSYYIIPFVPVMALVAGYGISLLRSKWLYSIVLTAGVVEGIANQQHDLFVKPTEQYKMSIEQIMDKVSSKEDLIVMNSNGNPQLIYLAHRKGWNCTNEQLSDSVFLNTIIAQGCRFIVIDKHVAPNLKSSVLSSNQVFENPDFLIFKTDKK